MAGSPAQLDVRDLSPRHFGDWDVLCASRGRFADVYATGSWFSAWATVAPGQDLDATRLACVLEGDRVTALLPMRHRPGRGWDTSGFFRYRTSPVVVGDDPPAESVALLAEQVSRTAGRVVTLSRLPWRDPATGALLMALRDAGYRVTLRPVERDNVTPVDGGWAGHAQRFRGFARYAQRMVSRTVPLWDVTMDAYGESPAWPVESGFALYADVQRRSWKGPLSDELLRHRRELLRLAEARGWARVFILRIGGVPAAGHIWFRIGGVATWFSTAYDARLATLSPGTVAQWWAHERMVDLPVGAGQVELVDLLPGANAQKDRVTAERPPLVDAVAARGLTVSMAARPASHLLTGVRRRVKSSLRAVRPVTGRESATPVSVTTVPPAAVAAWSASRVEPDTLELRFLSVAGGHPSVEAMTAAWSPDDLWLRVGPRPRGFVRVGPAVGTVREVREVVAEDSSTSVDGLLGAVATALGTTLRVCRADPAGKQMGDPTIVVASFLPWPRCMAAIAVDRAGGAA